MTIVAEILSTIFQDIIWGFVKRIGAIIRWVVLRGKYSFNQILKQNWNGRIGLLLILVGLLTAFYLKRKLDDPKHRIERAKSEVQQLESDGMIMTGDIIFQTSLSSQSKAIQLATKSKYSHCGIIATTNLEPVVLEAIQPVKITPLDEWIARGENGHYVIKRLKNRDQVLTTDALKKMAEEARKFVNKNYDLAFEWSDDKIYCSELIWKIYQRATGIEIGKLEKLSDFDLTNQAVQKKMKERYGNNIPKNETVISPASIFDSELLITVKAN